MRVRERRRVVGHEPAVSPSLDLLPRPRAPVPFEGVKPWRAGSGQPHLLRRILEALFDAPVRPDGVEISEDEVGQLFVVLKTVVDALDDATSAATSPV